MRRRGPDSLTSWLVMLCCCFISMLLFGVVRLSGVLFVATMWRFPSTTRNKASTPYTLCDFIMTIIGPVVGFLSSKFGARQIIMLGCTISSIGITLCFLAEDVITLDICWGVIFGFGFGLSTLPLPVIITQHFVRKRATAIGIMFSGSYVGFAILPTIVESLLNYYGLSGTFLWLSAFVLHCLPAAMLIQKSEKTQRRPSEILRRNTVHKLSLVPTENTDLSVSRVITESNMKSYENNSFSCKELTINHNIEFTLNKTENDTNDVGKNVRNKERSNTDLELTSFQSYGVESKIQDEKQAEFILNCKNITEKYTNQRTSLTMQYEEIKNILSIHSPVRESAAIQLCHLQKLTSINQPPIDNIATNSKNKNNFFVAFLDPIFLLVLFSAGVYGGTFIVFVTIIVDFTIDTGLPVESAKYVIMTYSVASNVGLLSFGWVTDGGYLSLTKFAGLLFLCRTATFVAIPLCEGFVALMALVSIQGLCEASLANLHPLILADRFDVKAQDFAVSSYQLLCGPFYLATPALIGFFRDYIGSYHGIFYLISTLSFICGILLFLAPLISHCHCFKVDDIFRKKESLTTKL